MEVFSEADSASAGRRVWELLDCGQAEEAIAFAESCDGPERVTDQLRALAYTHAGSMQQDRGRLEHAIALWKRAGAETHNAIGYNLANTQLELWELAVRERGFVAAFQDDRAHLQDARTLFRRAGHDEVLPAHLRIQAL